jgi:hypothetical protein
MVLDQNSKVTQDLRPKKRHVFTDSSQFHRNPYGRIIRNSQRAATGHDFFRHVAEDHAGDFSSAWISRVRIRNLLSRGKAISCSGCPYANFRSSLDKVAQLTFVKEWDDVSNLKAFEKRPEFPDLMERFESLTEDAGTILGVTLETFCDASLSPATSLKSDNLSLLLAYPYNKASQPKLSNELEIVVRNVVEGSRMTFAGYGWASSEGSQGSMEEDMLPWVAVLSGGLIEKSTCTKHIDGCAESGKGAIARVELHQFNARHHSKCV